MRVAVQLAGLEPKLGDAVAAHVEESWNPGQVAVSRELPPAGELDGLLVVSGGSAPKRADALITEIVQVGPADGETALGDTLFQVDAKLGRLSRSHLARESAKSFLTKEASVTRRELILGVRTGFRKYSNLPVV